jgi:helix-turn-helix protein
MSPRRVSVENHLSALSLGHLRDQEAFRDLLRDPQQIQDPVRTQDALFIELLDLAVHVYGVRQADLAKALSISRATVSRWLSGQSLPAAYVRPALISILADRVDAVASARRRRLPAERREGVRDT